MLAASTLYPGRTGHNGPVWAVAVTPDGKRLVTAGYDSIVMLWDAASGRQLRLYLGHYLPERGINGVAITPDGKRLISAGRDCTSIIWDVDTGRELRKVSIGVGWVFSVAVTPDGQRLVTGSDEGSDVAQIWDSAIYREILTLRGHKSAVHCVAVSPDGQRLALASSDGMARVWDMASRPGTQTLLGHRGAVGSIAVSPDAKWIVTGSEDSTAKVWDTASGRPFLKLEGHHVAVTPNGRRIITGSADGKVRIWDQSSGEKLLEIKGEHGDVLSVAVTPDGQRLVTGTEDGTMQLWDIACGRNIWTCRVSPSRISVAVTPDGQRVATGSWYEDNSARLWDISNARQILIPQVQSPGITSIALTPDGQRLLTGIRSGTITVWDIASGQELLSLNGHTGMVTCIAVTPASGTASACRFCQRIVTGSVDGTVRIWDAVSGQELLGLNAHTGPVRSVAVTPDGQRILTGSDDGTVQIWEAASPEQTTHWARQDQELSQRWAVWRKPVAGDPGFIQDWLILAPLKLKANQSGANGLDTEQLPGEARLHPRAGQQVTVNGRRYTWLEHHEKEPVLNFYHFVREQGNYTVAYAVCYVISAAERNDLLLQAGSDDEAKVYLNGQEVYKYTRVRALQDLDPIGPVTLHKGTNVLVLKVVNEYGQWLGCARFVDREGNPVPGLQVRLTPE
jgi:WD40 repeat protein